VLFATLALTGHSPLLVSILALILAPLLMLRQVKKRFAQAEAKFRQFSQRKRTAVVTVILMVIVLRVAALPWIKVENPMIHDEFSYLLMGDTFAHGRLTNPTSPMWQHFETMHVNQIPTYQSMYPVGQGLVLGASEWLTGNPWWGVLLSVALMAGVICWALQGWMPPEWALLGGIIAALRYGIVHEWVNSYWGGAVAAIGGALLLGALPRIVRKARIRDALLGALGLAIMANSRPYEGLVISIPLVLALLWGTWKRWHASITLQRILAPAALLLAITAAGMMHYNYRGTGHPLVTPYEVNLEQYHPTNPFIWQPLRPEPHYRFREMQMFYYMHERALWDSYHSAMGIFSLLSEKMRFFYDVFFWRLEIPFAVGWFFLGRNRRKSLLSWTLLIFMAGLAQVVWKPTEPYTAPATALTLAISIFGLRYLRTWKRHSGLGLAYSRAIVAVLGFWIVWGVYSMAANPPKHYYNDTRASIVKLLDKAPGKQLVIVHYSPGHFPYDEWVFNGADINGEKIVWARDMGPKNQELIKYFHDRHVWWINADAKDPCPEPYEHSTPLNKIDLPSNIVVGT